MPSRSHKRSSGCKIVTNRTYFSIKIGVFCILMSLAGENPAGLQTNGGRGRIVALGLLQPGQPILLGLLCLILITRCIFDEVMMVYFLI